MNHIYKNLYLGGHRAAENENLLKMYDIYLNRLNLYYYSNNID